ncbi:MAG: penicillin-binding protein activator LpoB [Planctomycetes bacterium]|nr:penicillin-binding protein activator LpoB [Planctomycetota bacterium]
MKVLRNLLVVLMVLVLVGCGPEARRGGPGTENLEMDEPAMSLKLDRADLDYMVRLNIRGLEESRFWMGEVSILESEPLVSIWPIMNQTSQHIDDQLDELLSSIETFLVNSGRVGVVSRERQAELIDELQIRQSEFFDPETAGRIGRQLGAKYYITGKISSVDEKIRDKRRVQYSLFMQVIEVETGLIKFQKEAIRSKEIKG